MFVVGKLDPSVVQNSGLSFQSISQMFSVHGEAAEGTEVIFRVSLIVKIFIQSDDGL
jgi:hypothetical protein